MSLLSREVEKQIKRLKGKLRGGATPLDCFRVVEWPAGARFFAKKKDDLPHELLMIGCGRVGDFLSIASDELQYSYFARADSTDADPLLFRVDHSNHPEGSEPAQRLSQLLAGFKIELLEVEDVEVPDQNLWLHLEARGAQKTKRSLRKLRRVTAGDSSIESLAGIEYCANLEDLELSGNRIGDFSPLAALAKLKWLSLHASADLSPLKKLSAVERLLISDPPALDFLSGWTKLKELKVKSHDATAPSLEPVPPTLVELELRGSTFAAQLASLSRFTGLTKLTLDTIEVDDLAPFAPLTRLQLFQMDKGSVTDASPIADCTELWYLQLRGPIRDLSFARKLTKLINLRLFDAAVEDLSPLAGSAIRVLVVQSELLEDLSPLTTLTDLESLFARGKKIRDLTPLAKIEKLRILDVWGTNVTDLSPVLQLPIDFLRIGPPFQDWQQLARFPKLTEVRYMTPKDMAIPTLPETPKVYFDRQG